MIRVKVFENFLEVEGHAGYDIEGRDVICAAVSGMAQLLGYTLARLGRDMVKKRGYLRVTWGKTRCESIVVETFLKALEDLQRKYPEHLRVEVMANGDRRQ